jgi:hypothetical protein
MDSLRYKSCTQLSYQINQIIIQTINGWMPCTCHVNRGGHITGYGPLISLTTGEWRGRMEMEKAGARIDAVWKTQMNAKARVSPRVLEGQADDEVSDNVI